MLHGAIASAVRIILTNPWLISWAVGVYVGVRELLLLGLNMPAPPDHWNELALLTTPFNVKLPSQVVKLDPASASGLAINASVTVSVSFPVHGLI